MRRVLALGLSMALAGCDAPDTASRSPEPPRIRQTAIGFPVGTVAPEIVGDDVYGESFALSDYRGKVVVLDFWGDW